MEKTDAGVVYNSFLVEPTPEELRAAVEGKTVDEALLRFFFSWSEAMRGWERQMALHFPIQPQPNDETP